MFLLLFVRYFLGTIVLLTTPKNFSEKPAYQDPISLSPSHQVGINVNMGSTSLPYYLIFCPAVMIYSMYEHAHKFCHTITHHHHEEEKKEETLHQSAKHVKVKALGENVY